MKDTAEILGQTVDLFFWPAWFSTDRRARAGWMASINGETYGDWVHLGDFSEGTRAEACEVLLEHAEVSIKLILEKQAV